MTAMGILRKLSVHMLADITMIATCVLASSILIYRTWGPPVHTLEMEMFKVGAPAPSIPADAFEAREHTLVMYLSSECHFCRESLPFYHRLTTEHGHSVRVQFVVASFQSQTEIHSFLADNGVLVDKVVQIPIGPPTPTLVLLDGKGLVEKVWMGKLTSDREREVDETVAHAEVG